MPISMQDANHILYGSRFLGCGGGGDEAVGADIIQKTVPKGVELMTLDALRQSGKKGLLVTISGVGSPASTTSYCGDETYTRVVELLKEKQAADSSLPQGEIIGLIPCEIGAASSFGPFMTAAQLGIPVVDASCDGRAHPLGVMGSIGLEKLPEPVIQVGCGGDPKCNMYLEVQVVGEVNNASDIIRSSAATAGGLVEVARNPVSGEYLERYSAKGAYELARVIGGRFLNTAGGTLSKLEAVCQVIDGKIIGKGTVGEITMETRNALDYGHFDVTMDGGGVYHMVFCNEYMAMDGPDGKRRFTFPDFMVTADAATGEPISSAKLREGMEIYLLGASRHKMLLGEGLRHHAPYERLESALQIEILKYIQDIINDFDS